MDRKRSKSYELPLLPLRGMLVFPQMLIHLDVGRDKSIRAVEEAMNGPENLLVVAAQKDFRVDDPTSEDMFEIGCLVEVKQLMRLPGGTVRVLVEGKSRARISGYLASEPTFTVKADEIAVPERHSPEIEALARTLVQQFENYARLSKKVPVETTASLTGIDEPGRLADNIAGQMSLKLEDKQAILEAFPLALRLEALIEIIGREVEILELERKINGRVRKQMEKSQREYYLREQMKAISKELGDRDDRQAEVDDFREKLAKLELPKDIAEKVTREIDRLEKMPAAAAEAVVLRNYVEWLLALPWNTTTEDQIDLKESERILEEDHYGLEKVKERILEYLAIRKLANTMRGPILCLVGPPGVGKTSLAKSIARAIGRKFVRISLGGVRDEAEIRGHRRTYVGALPGRIIQGMRTAGSKNPVFLMDEIDKLASDFRGDPASALLEVLDPEQNNTFSDHYVEAPFDLSSVLFITTANNQHNIPRPLLDRMEMISLPGYTEEEKVEIASRHIMPKVLKEHGLTAEQFEVSENAIRSVIREYTREAGVRNLQRELATIARKAAREVVAGREAPLRISTQNLGSYLGIPRYRWGEAEKQDEIGVATGLAVTDFGGDVMPIEVTVMKGKGNLLLTGKLGEVMRESAQAGFSYIRSRAAELGIEENFHEKYDLHVHIPEGSTPKEGPSAGVAMTTALVSALSHRPVRRDVAMTGEITLRGRVLPIGGVKEKVLGAHRAGITTVILPADNKKDLEEVPPTVRRRVNIVLVDHMDQALETALVDGYAAPPLTLDPTTLSPAPPPTVQQ